MISHRQKRVILLSALSMLFIACLIVARHTLRPNSGSPPPMQSAPPAPAEHTPNLLTNSNSLLVIGTEILRQRRAEASVESLNAPLDFWGIVVDQDDKPLAGVKLIATSVKWRLIGLTAKSDSATNQVVTDSSGRFVLKGIEGSSLMFREVTKPGYELARNTRTGFDYVGSEQFKGDPNRPEIFQMWQLRGAERTIVHSINKRIPCDGTPIYINLTTGEIAIANATDADLVVIVHRNPVESPPSGWRVPFDWKASIEVPQGGLLPTQDEFMYQAPDQGYQNTWAVENRKDSPSWRNDCQVKFFVKTANGNYARVEMEIRARFSDNRVGITVNSCLNPSGSRNLEYDEAKQ